MLTENVTKFVRNRLGRRLLPTRCRVPIVDLLERRRTRVADRNAGRGLQRPAHPTGGSAASRIYGGRPENPVFLLGRRGVQRQHRSRGLGRKAQVRERFDQHRADRITVYRIRSLILYTVAQGRRRAGQIPPVLPGRRQEQRHAVLDRDWGGRARVQLGRPPSRDRHRPAVIRLDRFRLRAVGQGRGVQQPPSAARQQHVAVAYARRRTERREYFRRPVPFPWLAANDTRTKRFQ